MSNNKKVFDDISKQNDCVYSHVDSKVPGQLGAFVHITKHDLKINHNDCIIEMNYDFGNSNTANFKINLQPYKIIPDFKLTTIDHFMKLILFKKQNWIIKCDDSTLNNAIQKLLHEHKLIDWIKKTAFEPEIKGIMIEKKYTIDTFFSLNYEGKTKSIKTILEFHKGLIDMLQSKYNR